MATCKDCLYDEICAIFNKDKHTHKKFDFFWCGLFKDKTQFVEVKRGEWDNGQFITTCGFFETKLFICSNCADRISVVLTPNVTMNYCPNCGAKMDVDGKEDNQ